MANDRFSPFPSGEADIARAYQVLSDEVAADVEGIEGVASSALQSDAIGVTVASQEGLEAETASRVELESSLGSKAPLNSPTFTGTPTAPTASPGTNTTQIATMAAVKAAIDAVIGGAPGALDTLNEIAAALAEDDSVAAGIISSLNSKADLVGGIVQLSQLPSVSFGIQLSALDTALTTGEVAAIPAPYNFTITSISAYIRTPSSSGVVQVDVKEGATSIFSTAKLTIDATETDSSTAATPAVISDANIAAGSILVFNVDLAGTGAKGLFVTIKGNRT